MANARASPAVCEKPNPLATGADGDPCGVNADCGPGYGCWLHAPIVNNDAGPIVIAFKSIEDLRTFGAFCVVLP